MSAPVQIIDGVSFICTGQGGRGGHPLSAPEIDTEGTSTQLVCTVCQREVRFGYKIVQKLRTSGLAFVDISRLPF